MYKHNLSNKLTTVHLKRLNIWSGMSSSKTYLQPKAAIYTDITYYHKP